MPGDWEDQYPAALLFERFSARWDGELAMTQTSGFLQQLRNRLLGSIDTGQDSRGQLAAIHRSMGVIEFSLDGHILTANDNFLGAMGYSLAEVKGRHHSMFVDADYRDSQEYR